MNSNQSKSIAIIEKGLLAIYILLGIWAALNVGISWDEEYELNIFTLNVNSIIGLLTGNTTSYSTLLNFQDRYYGIGFHALAHFFTYAASAIGFTPDWHNVISKQLLLKHIPVFMVFVLSGYIVKKILLALTQNQLLASCAMFCFLLWPYLLGHGLMNIKDMPFLFAWLLCTYRALVIFDRNLIAENSQYLVKNIALLAVLTAWLCSIRISGILIFIEYGLIAFAGLLFLGFWQSLRKLSLRSVVGYCIIFLIPYFFILFLLYPIFWHNPIEFINAIFYQSHNPIVMDTLTAGNIISNRSNLIRYVPIWLGVKLPLLVLLGLALSPLLWWKYIQTENTTIKINIVKTWCLLGSPIVILCFLILNRVHLYNELRHILFIFPLLFIAGITSLFYISRILCIALLLLTSIIFVIDDVKLHPYQYTYLNELTRQFPISQQFEKDYFALSAGRTALWLNEQGLGTSRCIYASPLHVWLYKIDQVQFPCNQDLPGQDLRLEKRSFLLYGQIRNPDIPPPLPSCKILHSEKRVLFLSNYTLEMSRLYACEPILEPQKTTNN